MSSLRTSHGLPLTETMGTDMGVPREGVNPISKSQSQRLSGMGPSFIGNTTSLPFAGKGARYFSPGAVMSLNVIPMHRGCFCNESREAMALRVF